MKKRLLAGLVGLIFGLIVGALFIAMFTSMLENANAYNNFVNEVPGGFLKILAVCSLVPAAIFLLIPESWAARILTSLEVLFIILVITIIALIVSTFGVVNSIATFFLIAALFGGGSSVIIIIISN